jgi:hypothetical protein
MSSATNKQAGFSIGIIAVVILLALIIASVGIVVFKKSDRIETATKPSTAASTTPQSAAHMTEPSPTPRDPYAGWKTAKLASEELSFKYPSDWTLKGSADNIAVTSPMSDDHYFEISLITATDPRNIDLNFLGEPQSATMILDLEASYNGLPLYLAASMLPDGRTLGLGLVAASPSAKTSFGIDIAKSVSGKYITMSANLLPVAGNGVVWHPLQTYKDNASYSTVLKIFQSLVSGKN